MLDKKKFANYKPEFLWVESLFNMNNYILHTHCLRMNYYVQKMGEGLRSQWNSAQRNNRNPWQSKSWGPFCSYQPIYCEDGTNGLNWLCSLAGSSKTAPRILIFSIAMGAKHSLYSWNSLLPKPPLFLDIIIYF